MNDETRDQEVAPESREVANSGDAGKDHGESSVPTDADPPGDDSPAESEIDSELANIIEAALFSSDEPVGVRKLIAMFPKRAAPSRIDIQNALLKLQRDYEGRGIELQRIGKGWRFQSREKYADFLRQLFRGKSPRYSRALLETLAIIAYRQPVTRGDIEEIRGITVSSETVRTLLEREWVQEIGHRDVPGRPALLGTTEAFLQHFSLSSLKDLPELLEPREIGEIASELNLTLPMEAVEEDNQPESEDEHTAEVIPLHPDGPAETMDEGQETALDPESSGDAPEDKEQTGKESRPGDGDDLIDEGEDP